MQNLACLPAESGVLTDNEEHGRLDVKDRIVGFAPGAVQREHREAEADQAGHVLQRRHLAIYGRTDAPTDQNHRALVISSLYLRKKDYINISHDYH